MARSIEEEALAEEDTLSGKFLTFSLDNECYGIEIKHVTEIIGVQSITAVPETPEYIRGVINLRGTIIPVMDVRLRFRKPFRAYNDRTCVIVVDIRDVSIGLIVDRVSEVITIPDGDIVDPPEMNNSQHAYIKGIGKVGTEVKLILDCDELIGHDDSERIAALH